MFNPVAHYEYLLANMYLFIADIANTCLFELSDLDSSRHHPLLC